MGSLLEVSKQIEIEEVNAIRKAKEFKRVIEINAMPLYQKIQQPEHKEWLIGMEARQQEAWDIMIKRDYKHLLPNRLQLFDMYWRDYLKGKVHDMNKWIKGYDQDNANFKQLKK